MKNVKKLLSIVMVLTLVLSLGASALAVDVTIKDEDENSTYTAYQLLKADNDGELYQYTLNATFIDAIKAGFTALKMEIDVSAANQNKVVDAISKLSDTEIRTFADAAFEAIQADADMKAAGVSADGKQFSGMDGYYLIAETVDGAETGTAASLVMLGTYGIPQDEKIVVTTKEEHPSSEKKVQDVNDSDPDVNAAGNWQDSADYDIGDDVPFKLTAKIPAGTTTAYEEYMLTFHDTEGPGLSFNNDVKVSLNDTPLTGGYTVNVPGADGCSFDIVFTDIKGLADFDGTAENVITVEYTSELGGEDVVIGNPGNPNTMHIEYSNNPYGEGTGKTPDDTVRVFTYTVDVDKVDGADKALAGAGFTLLKKVDGESAKVGDQTYEGYKQIGEAKMVQGVDAEGKPTDDPDEIERYTVDFKGLDDGVYKLVESTVPENYNKAPDVDFTVSAAHTEDDKGTNEQKLTELTGSPFERSETGDGALNGHLNGTVVNLTGVELPSTGGIGTTIFYVVGAILVAGAVILLVSRKRASGADK